MANARPMKKSTGNDAGSKWAAAKISALKKIADTRDIPFLRPINEKLRKKISSQNGA
jgi:hypothetical protein